MESNEELEATVAWIDSLPSSSTLSPCNLANISRSVLDNTETTSKILAAVNEVCAHALRNTEKSDCKEDSDEGALSSDALWERIVIVLKEMSLRPIGKEKMKDKQEYDISPSNEETLTYEEKMEALSTLLWLATVDKNTPTAIRADNVRRILQLEDRYKSALKMIIERMSVNGECSKSTLFSSKPRVNIIPSPKAVELQENDFSMKEFEEKDTCGDLVSPPSFSPRSIVIGPKSSESDGDKQVSESSTTKLWTFPGIDRSSSTPLPVNDIPQNSPRGVLSCLPEHITDRLVHLEAQAKSRLRREKFLENELERVQRHHDQERKRYGELSDRLSAQIQKSAERERYLEKELDRLMFHQRSRELRFESEAIDRENKLRLEIKTLKIALNKAISRGDDIKNELDNVREEATSLRDEVDVLRPLEQKLQENVDQLQTCRANLEEITADREMMKMEIDVRSKVVVTLEEEVERLRPLQRELQDTRNHCTVKEDELADCHKKIEEAKKEVSVNKEQFLSQKTTYTTEIKGLKETIERLAPFEQQAKRTSASLALSEKKVSEYQAELKLLKETSSREIADLHSEKESQERLISTLKREASKVAQLEQKLHAEMECTQSFRLELAECKDIIMKLEKENAILLKNNAGLKADLHSVREKTEQLLRYVVGLEENYEQNDVQIRKSGFAYEMIFEPVSETPITEEMKSTNAVNNVDNLPPGTPATPLSSSGVEEGNVVEQLGTASTTARNANASKTEHKEDEANGSNAPSISQTDAAANDPTIQIVEKNSYVKEQTVLEKIIKVTSGSIIETELIDEESLEVKQKSESQISPKDNLDRVENTDGKNSGVGEGDEGLFLAQCESRDLETPENGGNGPNSVEQGGKPSQEVRTEPADAIEIALNGSLDNRMSKRNSDSANGANEDTEADSAVTAQNSKKQGAKSYEKKYPWGHDVRRRLNGFETPDKQAK